MPCVRSVPRACRAGPWAGRSASAPATGTAGSAPPARSRASGASSRPRPTRPVCAGHARRRAASSRARRRRSGSRRSAAKRRTRRRASPCRRRPRRRRSPSRPSAAIAGSVTKVAPPITPARPASAQPAPNTSMNTRGTLWPSASTISGWVSALWMTRPMRVRVSSSQSATSISQRDQHHEAARRRERRADHAHVRRRPGTSPPGAAPGTTCRPVDGRVDERERRAAQRRRAARSRPRCGPRSAAPARRPRTSRPNVISSSGTWPNLCTRRRQ